MTRSTAMKWRLKTSDEAEARPDRQSGEQKSNAEQRRAVVIPPNCFPHVYGRFFERNLWSMQ